MDTIELAEVAFMRPALYRRHSAVEAEGRRFEPLAAGEVSP